MKARPTIAPASARCLRAAGLERAHREPGGGDEQQHEQRVRVVDAGDRDRHRRDRQRGGGEQAGGGPNTRRTVANSSADGARSCTAPAAAACENEREAEHARREAHQPQRQRRLVDGDEAARVERAEEPRLPALAPGLGGGGVVRRSSSRERSGPTGTAAPRAAARPRSPAGPRQDPRGARGRASAGGRRRRGGRAGRWWRTTGAPCRSRSAGTLDGARVSSLRAACEVAESPYGSGFRPCPPRWDSLR